MLGTILLINLAGAVALLLWGTHMVSSGVLRGFGTVLRNWPCCPACCCSAWATVHAWRALASA